MPTITKQQMREILMKAPAGTTPAGIQAELQRRGFTIEGAPTLSTPTQVQTPAGAHEPTDKPKENFFVGELKGGAQRSDDEGLIESFAKDVFQSTLGSKGVLGVAQLPGQVLAQPGALKSQTELANSNAGLADATTRLIKIRRNETDPARRERLTKQINENLKLMSGTNEETRGLDRFVKEPKDALATTANAALTVSPLGTGKVAATGLQSIVGKTATQFGKGVLPKALETGVVSTGFQATANIDADKPVTEDTFKAFLIGSAIPVGTAGLGAAKDKLVGQLPSRLVNSVIKPLSKDFAYGKNPGATVAEQKITANSFDDLANKVSQRKTEVGAQAEQLLTRSNKTVNMNTAYTNIDDAINNARRFEGTNKPVISRLETIKSDLQKIYGDDLGQMSVVEANKFKQDVGSLTKWTGSQTDDELINKTLKQTYGHVNDKVTRAVPEVKALNETYGGLLSAEVATKYRSVLAQRQNLTGLAVKTGTASAALLSLFTNPAALPAVLAAGVGASMLDKALSSPAVKTRAASWLSKTLQNEQQQIFRQVPGLQEAFIRAGLIGSQR